METTSVSFAAAARALGAAARARGLRVPAFRSPPRVQGAERTVRRWGDGGATVSVVLRGRPLAAVMADMVEGTVVANGLSGTDATRARTALWEAVAVGAPVGPPAAERPDAARPAATVGARDATAAQAGARPVGIDDRRAA
ncbi:MAG: hypothetical protein HYX34_14585 [Actinobacteria bacterium]|nr:hypothetical protein [Actinomycetota bacterium]